MITKEQYDHYKKLVEEYEAAEFEDNMRQAEEDTEFDYYFLEDEEDDTDRSEIAFSCTCGAYTFNQDRTKVIHVADCICGAD